MATIKDVAKEAGLSVTTVSRVMNNRGYISDETKKKVADAMAAIGYKPNEMARMLSKQSSNIIGVIVPHITHPYFAQLISGIEKRANYYKYRIMLFNSKDNTEKLKEYLEMCESSRVAGIILCSGDVAMKEINSLGVPLVTIERYLEDGTATVECDNTLGGEIAAKMLIEAGCKNLLCIGGVFNNAMPADDRTKGFEKICVREGVNYCIEGTTLYEYKQMEYKAELETILLSKPEIDGIFASSDIIAAQTIQVCHKLNRNIPKDIKLIGFDDVILASLTSPQISTIHQPISEMSEIAVDLLVKAADGNVVPRRTILPVEYVKRETT